MTMLSLSEHLSLYFHSIKIWGMAYGIETDVFQCDSLNGPDCPVVCLCLALGPAGKHIHPLFHVLLGK
jgi:hypothetical protein